MKIKFKREVRDDPRTSDPRIEYLTVDIKSHRLIASIQGFVAKATDWVIQREEESRPS